MHIILWKLKKLEEKSNPWTHLNKVTSTTVKRKYSRDPQIQGLLDWQKGSSLTATPARPIQKS